MRGYLRWLVTAVALSAVTCAGAGGQTTIFRPGYTATLDAEGALTSLKLSGIELLGKPLEFCPGTKWTLDRMEKSGEQEVHIFLKSDKGTGEIDYRFEPKRVLATLTQKLGGFQSWNAIFTDAVLGVENLQNTRVNGAEIIQYVERGDIRPTPLNGLRRSQRMRLHLRNGATLLFWHDGWGAPFNVDEIGSFTGYGYHRNLLENNKPMQVTFELEHPAAKPLQPAPAYVPNGDSFGNIFLYDHPIAFTLKFTDATLDRLKSAKSWRVGWTVTDFFLHPVTTGSATFDAATAQSAKQTSIHFACPSHGWFDLVFTLTPVAPTSDTLPSEYRTRFAVVENQFGFPQLPEPGTHLSDYGYAALIGMKCIRESHTMRDYFPERGKIDWKRLDEVIDNAGKEASKWHVNWFFQVNEVPQWCTPADYEQIAYEMVNHCKDRCKTWEVENEPNFRFSPEDYLKKAFLPFATGAKRADPTCSIIGPACVSVPNSLRFLEAIQAAGDLKLLDGVSTHTYMGPGEPWELFGNPEYLAKLHSLAPDKPLWQTEQGYTWNHSSRQEQARYVVRQYLNAEATGIANERQYYFYPVHNGFEPWYLVEMGGNDDLSGTLEPAGVALRVQNEQIMGQEVDTLEQPLPGVFLLRYKHTGSIQGRASDTVALWTLDFPLTLVLKGIIVKAIDFMGNPVALKQRGDETEVPIDGYALYLHVPDYAKLQVVGPNFGKNLASAAQGAVATASSETKDHPAAHAIDGQWAMRDAVPGLATRTYWEAAKMGASEADPQWLQVDFPAERTLDRSLLLTPLPAVDGGVPRDYTVQVSEDGQSWQTVATVKDWVGWAGMVSFKPVKTRHARLLITRLNDGWHLDGKWEFMVNASFTRYTSMQVRVLDWMLFGP